MCARISTNGKSPKDLILEAAFSFYEKPHFDDFSMSELAARVGVTKTAIYRHFKSRDEVVEAMQHQFFELIADRLIEVQKSEIENKQSESNEIYTGLISFFAENPQYINYFISQFSMIGNYEEVIRDELKARVIGEATEDFFNSDFTSEGIKKGSSILFCSVSLLIFIKIREQLANFFGHKTNVNEFSRKLIIFLRNGFKGCVDVDSTLYPTEINEQRRKELDKICSINEKDLPEENKIFKAMAAVIKKHKLNGVTVERIADELNMAKSSLYFYFENKNQMIASLVNKELSLLATIAQENIAEAKNYSEYIYISLHTELSYFMKRASIIPICGWLLQSNVNNFGSKADCEDLDIKNRWEAIISEDLKKLDLEISLYPQMFTFWMGILVVALVIMSDKHGFSENQTEQVLNNIFSFIQNGADC